VHSEEYEAQAADFDRDAATLPGAIPFGLESAESLRERGFAPSERAEDVLVLGRESCRECHGGSRATPPEVASGCVMCHPYHHPSREPIGGGVAGAHASLEGQGLGFAR
jgi:hypothetical protein